MKLTRRKFIGCLLTGAASLFGLKFIFKWLEVDPEITPTSVTKATPRTAPDLAREKEAMFYQKKEKKRVECNLCFRSCLIPEGGRGFCRVRENKGGKLYSLVYGQAMSFQIDSIEKEPMYHLLPGHRNFCVYTASCNFRCKHCHNWHISQRPPEEFTRDRKFTPQRVVEEALRQRCKSISHSINEPTIFYEFMHDIVKEAKQRGLYTLFHTNGSLSPKALKKILKYIDGVTVDLKAFTDNFYQRISQGRLEPVLETLKIIKKEKVHLEIVNLVIPTLNDSSNEIKEMSAWIVDKLGKNTPIHFTRFTPRYKLTNLPLTPVGTLERAARIAKEAGLNYVYIGNLPGHKLNSTFCPNCDKKLIRRRHILVQSNYLKAGRCKFCQYQLPGVWRE